MTFPLAVVGARLGLVARRLPDEENRGVAQQPRVAGSDDSSIDSSTSSTSSSDDATTSNSDCLAIVPVLRARFPHMQPHRAPLVVRTRAASHHVHFLMDEDEEEELAADLDEHGRVACRALVLHPTKHKSGAHRPAPRPRASMDSLPCDTLKQIFRFLPAPSLCAAEMTCPLWRSIAAQDDAWWASLCEAEFGVSPDSFTPPPDPTKLLYMLQHSSFVSIKRGGAGGGGASRWARFF